MIYLHSARGDKAVADQNTNYIIRRATQKDIGSMIGLFRVRLSSIEEESSFDELIRQKGLEMMLSDSMKCCIMVAELKREIVGMCTAQILVSVVEGGTVAFVEDLIVEGLWRGHGIGKELLFSVEWWASARGVNRIQLLANRNNISALHFYEKMNWRPTELVCLHKKELV